MAVSQAFRLLWITGTVFGIFPHLNLGLLSDYKICGDSECESLMSRVQAIRDHHGKDCRFLSFRRGDTIFVYHKLTGKREDLWAGTIDKQFGYFPKDAVQEEQVYATVEKVVETQRSDFFCMDESGYLIDSSDLDSDNEADDQKIQIQESECTQTIPYTDGTNTESPPTSADPSTEFPVPAQQTDDTTPEGDERKNGGEADPRSHEEAHENPAALNEQGGSSSSSWLGSSVTGWLGLGKEEEYGSLGKEEKEDERKETQDTTSLTSSVTGWLGLGKEDEHGSSGEEEKEGERKEAQDTTSLTSSVTGWLGIGKEDEHGSSGEEEKEGERKETQDKTSLTSSVTGWLGFGEDREPDVAVQSGEGSKETTDSFTSTMTGWLGFGGETKTDSVKNEQDGETEMEEENELQVKFRSRRMSLDLEGSQLHEEEKTEMGTLDWLRNALSDGSKNNVLPVDATSMADQRDVGGMSSMIDEQRPAELEADEHQIPKSTGNEGEDNNREPGEEEIKTASDTGLDLTLSDINSGSEFGSADLNSDSTGSTGGEVEGDEKGELQSKKTGSGDEEGAKIVSAETGASGDDPEGEGSDEDTDVLHREISTTQTDESAEQSQGSGNAAESSGTSSPFLSLDTAEERNEPLHSEDQSSPAHSVKSDADTSDTLAMTDGNMEKEAHRGELGEEGGVQPVGGSSQESTPRGAESLYEKASEQESVSPQVEQRVTEYEGDTDKVKETEKNTESNLHQVQTETETLEFEKGFLTESGLNATIGSKKETKTGEGEESKEEEKQERTEVKQSGRQDEIQEEEKQQEMEKENPDEAEELEEKEKKQGEKEIKEEGEELKEEKRLEELKEVEEIKDKGRGKQKVEEAKEDKNEEMEEAKVEKQEEVEGLKEEEKREEVEKVKEEKWEEVEEAEEEKREEVEGLKEEEKAEEEQEDKQEEVEGLKEEEKREEVEELREEKQGEVEDLKEEKKREEVEEESEEMEEVEEAEEEKREEVEDLKEEEKAEEEQEDKQEEVEGLKEEEKAEEEQEDKQEEVEGLKEEEKREEVEEPREEKQGEVENLKEEEKRKVEEAKEDKQKQIEEFEEKGKQDKKEALKEVKIEVKKEDEGEQVQSTQNDISRPESESSEKERQDEKTQTEEEKREKEKKQQEKVEEIEEEKKEAEEIQQVNDVQNDRRDREEDREEEESLKCSRELCPRATDEESVRDRDKNVSEDGSSSADEGTILIGNPKHPVLPERTGESQTVPSEGTDRDRTQQEEDGLEVDHTEDSDLPYSGENGLHGPSNETELDQTYENREDGQLYPDKTENTELSNDKGLSQRENTEPEDTETSSNWISIEKKPEQTDSDHKTDTEEDIDVRRNENTDSQMNNHDDNTTGRVSQREERLEPSATPYESLESQTVISEQTVPHVSSDSPVTVPTEQPQTPPSSDKIQTSAPSHPHTPSPNTETPLQTKTLSKYYKNLLTYTGVDEMTILMELFGRHKLQFLDYMLGSSDTVTVTDPDNDGSILSDIERLLHYHRETVIAPSTRLADTPQEDKEKTRTVVALQKLEMLITRVRETFNTGNSDTSKGSHQAHVKDQRDEDSTKTGDPSVAQDNNIHRDEGMHVESDGQKHAKERETADDKRKQSQKRGSEEESVPPAPRPHNQPGSTQLLEGEMKQILDFIHWMAEESTTHVHSVIEFLLWTTVQVVSSLPDDIRPGPDLYGVPWEPVIISSLVGLVTVLLFTCRCYSSVKSRMYRSKERWMAEQVAQLLDEKCKVLESLSKCQQEYDDLEDSLRDSGILAQTQRTEHLEVKARQLEHAKRELERDLEQLKDQLDQQREHRIEQERRIALLEESMKTFEDETKDLQSQEVQAQTTLKVYNMNSDRLQRNLETAGEENTLLQESNAQLRQQVEGWAERVSELEAEMRRCEIAFSAMQQDVANKDERIMSLTDSLLRMKAWDSDLEEKEGEEGAEKETSNGPPGEEENGKGDITDTPGHFHKVQKLIYAAKLNADLKSVDEDKDRVFAKLNDEVKAKEDLQESIKELENEKLSLQSGAEHYSDQVQRLQQKLQIMTEMYQENELKLHRLLTVEEKERLQKEEKLNKADKNIAMAMEELNNYRQRAEEMEEELEKTKQSYQTQISAREKKAHSNWLAARAADRELSDIRRENALLRQKLTDTQFKLDALDKDPFALDSLARPLPFRAERSPYGPSPLGRPASETRAFLSPPTLMDGPPARLSPRVCRGPMEPPGGQGEMERSGGPHSDSGSISPTWERDRRGPMPGPPGPPGPSGLLGPPGYMFPEPGGPMYRRPPPPPGALLPPPGSLPPGPPLPHPRGFPSAGPLGPPHPADMADGPYRENSLGPGEQEHTESGPGDRRTPPESDPRMGGPPPPGPSMGPMDGPFPRRPPYGPPPPDFYPPRGPGGPPMMPMWAPPPPGVMFPPRFPPGGPPLPPAPHPHYAPPMRPLPPDSLPPPSMGPPPPQQSLHSPPNSQPSPEEHRPSPEDAI